MNGSKSNVYSLKCLATASLCLLVAVLSITPLTSAQFFTKTSKSVPRMGRRSDPTALASENSPTFSQAVHLVRHFDSDGDGALSPEELSMVPLLRLAFSSPPSVSNQEQRLPLDNLRKQMNALLNGEKGLTSALDDPLEWEKKRR